MAETSSPTGMEPKKSMKAKESTVARAALAMSSGTMLSRVLGFVRDAVLLGIFDRTTTDAYLVGFRLPNLFRRLVGEGAMTISFIPIYVELLKKDEKKAGQLASSVFTALLILTSTLLVLGVIFMPQILNYWIGSEEGGFASIPGKMELTVLLSRIMLSYLVLVTTYAFYMAISNSLGHFFWPAMAPALFNVIAIIFTFMPAFSVHGDQLAYGTVFGGVAQLFVVFFLLVKLRVLPGFRFHFRETAFLNVIGNMIPGMMGLGIFQLMTIVNTNFASRLEEGAQTYIYCADRILELPQSLVAISLGVALLPKFSGHLADGRVDLVLREAQNAMKLLLFLAIPSAVGMALLAKPITELLFARGEFNAHDVVQTAMVVAIYSMILIASGISKILSPGFYALKNTWLPAVIAAVCLLLHLLWGNYLVAHFGLGGLATATALAAGLNMILVNVYFNKLLGPIGWSSVIWEMRRWILGVFWIAVVCLYLLPWMGTQLDSRVATLICISLAGIGYFLLAAFSRAPEANFVLSKFKRKMKKSL